MTNVLVVDVKSTVVKIVESIGLVLTIVNCHVTVPHSEMPDETGFHATVFT